MSASETTIYLDNNATTPIDPRVLEVMMPYLTGCFGNAASRTHAFGWEAEEAVETARADIARLIGARPKEIVFTSGATEATNLALKGLAERHPQRDHLVTAATEHKATLDTCKYLEKHGRRTTILPVDREGRIDLDRLRDAMTERTLAVSLMLVNNEVGVIHPIEEIGEICRERGVYFHCDAAQAFGKIPIDVRAAGIHLLSVSGHKIYAPKGVGILYVRGRDPKVELAEQASGGGHETGLRSGTLNVPGIVGLGAAAKIAGEVMDEEGARVETLRDRLRHELEANLADTHVNGAWTPRIHGNLNISFRGVESEGLLMALPRLAVSSGSACTSDSVEPSFVLKAMGLPDDISLSAVRFGVGRFTTEQEIDEAATLVIDAVDGLRGAPPAGRREKRATSSPSS